MRDDFPLLRSILGDPYAEAEGDELAAVVESIYGPGATPEDVENFFSSIGNGFKKAAGAVGGFAKKALPGVLSGALSGAAVGGPWGALIGAVAGGAGSALAGSKNKMARTLGGALGSAGNVLSTVRGGGAAGALGGLLNIGGRGPAGGVGSLAALGTGALGSILQPGGSAPGGASANTLMAMLSRPELLQSVLAGTMGQFGRTGINVGGQTVPVHAMLSTLSKVAGRAAQEVAELDEQAAEDVPEYVSWAEAEFGIDPDDAEGRADALLLALALAPNLWAGPAARPPITVNVTNPDPREPPLPTAEAWTELTESSVFEWESDESDWEGNEAWTDGEDSEAWAGELQESAYAWQ